MLYCSFKLLPPSRSQLLSGVKPLQSPGSPSGNRGHKARGSVLDVLAQFSCHLSLSSLPPQVEGAWYTNSSFRVWCWNPDSCSGAVVLKSELKRNTVISTASSFLTTVSCKSRQCYPYQAMDLGYEQWRERIFVPSFHWCHLATFPVSPLCHSPWHLPVIMNAFITPQQDEDTVASKRWAESQWKANCFP